MIFQTPFEVISTAAQLVGWGAVVSFIGWLWRKSIIVSVEFSKRQEKGDQAMEQVNKMATNDLPHLFEEGQKTNEHLETQTNLLSSIDRGIAVLVDRRNRGSER